MIIVIYLFLRMFSPTIKVESPRPTSRKKNKPAPVPPGLSALGSPKNSVSTSSLTSTSTKTPDREERKNCVAPDNVATLERLSIGDGKPSLPPTGPDSKRLSALEKRPALAPRPSLNPYTERTASQSTHPSTFKTDDETVEVRKSNQTPHKRLSSLENATGAINPTHHPNAVPMFGFASAPAPLERTKFEGDKIKPNIPERPSVIKLQGIDHSQREPTRD